MDNSQDKMNSAAQAANDTSNNGSMGGAQEFDPRALALNQNFAAMVGVKKELSRVAIQRPPNQAFFLPNPNPDYRIQVAALVLNEDHETYVVDHALLDELQGEWVPKLLVACQTRQGGMYLWPIKLPGPDGRIDTWNESALQIVNDYGGQWVRVTANKELGAYDVARPISPFPMPEWPESADALLRKAFRGRIIDRLDHPIIKQLRGVA